MTTVASRPRPDPVWSVVLLLAVLLPVAGVVGAALTGVGLLLVPAVLVAGAVALALGFWT